MKQLEVTATSEPTTNSQASMVTATDKNRWTNYNQEVQLYRSDKYN
jgi:hypothetical protein